MEILDPLSEFSWQYLDIKDILRLCRTNSRFAQICSYSETWKYLLERDYNIHEDMGDPRERYMKIYTYKPAQLYEVSIQIPIDTGISEEEFDKETLDFLLQQVQIDYNIKRGDIVHVEEMGTYRNDGKFIYDGTKLNTLYDDVDDYGSVPPEFTIGNEFKPQHWRGVIDHNTIIWINLDKYGMDIIKNVYIENDITKSWFEGYLGRFTIVFLWDTDEERGEMSMQSFQYFKNRLEQGREIAFEAINWISTDYDERNPNEIFYISY